MTLPHDDFTGLKALFINCTLKRSPEVSNTQGLVDISAAIMEKHGIVVDVIRAIDHDIATGVWPDMTEHGWPTSPVTGMPPRMPERSPDGPDRYLAAVPSAAGCQRPPLAMGRRWPAGGLHICDPPPTLRTYRFFRSS